MAEPQADHDATVKALDGFGVDKKVLITRLAICGAVAIGVLVRNVVTDADVHGHRDAELVSIRQDADIAMREVLGDDPAAEILAKAESQAGGVDRPVVQNAGIVPEAKLPGPDVAGDTLGRGADARQFEIVDGTGTVHGDMRERSAAEQVDDLSRHARLDHVRAHHQNPRAGSATRQPRRDNCERLLQARIGLRGLLLYLQQVAEIHVVGSLGQGPDDQLRAVKGLVFRFHRAKLSGTVDALPADQESPNMAVINSL